MIVGDGQGEPGATMARRKAQSQPELRRAFVVSALVVCRTSPVARFGESGALLPAQDAVEVGPFDDDEDAARGVIWPMKYQRTCETGH